MRKYRVSYSIFRRGDANSGKAN